MYVGFLFTFCIVVHYCTHQPPTRSKNQMASGLKIASQALSSGAYNYAIVGGDCQIINLELKPGQSVRCEPGMLMHMDPNVTPQTSFACSCQRACAGEGQVRQFAAFFFFFSIESWRFNQRYEIFCCISFIPLLIVFMHSFVHAFISFISVHSFILSFIDSFIQPSVIHAPPTNPDRKSVV